MSLKVLLNLLITGLLLLVMMVGLVLMLDNARDDIRAEIDSTANLALHLLDTEILYYSSGSSVNVWPESPFRLSSLGQIRHLRIEFFDARGHLRDSNRAKQSQPQKIAPDWFFNAMSGMSPRAETTRRQVFYMGHILGELVVTPDPSYEIAEIWHDTVGLVELVVVFFVLVNFTVYWAVSRALKPVDKLLEALTLMESGRLDARLPAFRLPELSRISTKFNHMAHTLQRSIGQVHELNQKIVLLQEEERKHLARELHDEVGQCLTAIHVDANAILHAKKLPDAHESANAILDITRHMKEMVRDMLQRLRPTVLDELGLQAALRDLVDTWQERNKSVICQAEIEDGLDERLEGAMAMAVYRMVQESLTNIARHASATHAHLEIAVRDGVLLVSVEDDGLGFDDAIVATGFGLTGMRERVEGLGGEYRITSIPGRGTSILVRIPCEGEVIK